MMETTKSNGLRTQLIYILVLAAGLFLGNFIFTLLKNKTLTSLHPPQEAAEVIPAPLAPAPADNPPQEPGLNEPKTTNFTLNGIYFSEGAGIALINNQIVKEGEFVDGAKVGPITTTSVELDNAGQTILLQSNR